MTPYIYNPEIVLLSAIQNLLNFVRKDLKDHATTNTPEQSYLYKVFNQSALENYDYYNECKVILQNNKNSQRYFTVDIAFNSAKNVFPSGYIALGAEQEVGNGMSNDEGYDTSFGHGDVNTGAVYTRRYGTTYLLYLYSDNYLEVAVLYSLMKTLFISFTDHLAVMGIGNLTVAGQDINQVPDMVPKNTFLRAMSIRFEYETAAPSNSPYPSYNNIIYQNFPTLQ